jgi:hypothetical protein
LNFSSSGGEQLRKRFLELLNHCGGSLSLPSAVASSSAFVFTEYELDCLDLYLVELGPRIVNRRNRTLIPIGRERDATATPPNLLRNNFESRAYSIWLANGTVPAFTWNCNHS